MLLENLNFSKLILDKNHVFQMKQLLTLYLSY